MAIAVGVTSKGRSASAASIATTGVTTQAAGSTFVVGVIWGGAFNFTSLVDSKSNSYTQIGSEIAFDTAKSRFYYCQNGTGGASHTATLTITGGTGCDIFFLEITGGLTTGILDQSNGRADASSPFTLASGLTTTQANELLVSFLAGNSGSNPATHAESGLGSSTVQTGAEETNGASFWTGALATAIKSSTGTFNPSWTETGGSSTSAWLATFKANTSSAPLPLLRTLIRAPEQVESGFAHLSGRVPEGIDKPPPSTFHAAPEQVESGYIYFTGRQPEGIDKPPPSTLHVAPEQIASGSAWLYRFTPPAVVVDSPPPSTVHAAPEQYYNAASWVYKTTPLFLGHRPIGVTRVSAPEQIPSGLSIEIGRFVYPAVAAADKPVAWTRVSAPQQVESGYTHVTGTLVEEVGDTGIFYSFEARQESTEQWGGCFWGYTPEAVGDVGVFHSFVAEQESTEQWGGKVWGSVAEIVGDLGIFYSFEARQESTEQWGGRVWGTAKAAPAGTDKPIGRFSYFCEPFYEPVQYGLVTLPNETAYGPPEDDQGEDEDEQDEGWFYGKRKKQLFVEIDGQTFPVSGEREAVQLLHQARALAEKQAEQRAERVTKVLGRKAAVPVVNIPAPEITVSKPLAEAAAPVIADIKRLYRQAAETAELRLLLKKQLEADDDDDDVLLLL